MKKRTTVLLTGLAMTLLPMAAAPSAQAVCGEVGGPYVNANGCLMPAGRRHRGQHRGGGRLGRGAAALGGPAAVLHPAGVPYYTPGICPADQRRCCTMLTTLPSGARTKNR